MDCLESLPPIACTDTRSGRAARRRRGDLVPVCSWCLKVRNHTGAWLPAEPGLLERAGHALTHGVCPDCARELLLARRAAA